MKVEYIYGKPASGKTLEIILNVKDNDLIIVNDIQHKNLFKRALMDIYPLITYRISETHGKYFNTIYIDDAEQFDISRILSQIKDLNFPNKELFVKIYFRIPCENFTVRKI